MKKVIDRNYLTCPELMTYLACDRSNYVILTDFVAMEIYKGNSCDTLFRSLEIVSQFPNQVIVLKSTREIIGISPEYQGIAQKMIDNEQTKGFKEFCWLTHLAQRGNRTLLCEIDYKRKMAFDYLENLKNLNVMIIINGIKQLIKSFDPKHLKALRSNRPLPDEIFRRIQKDVLTLSALLMKKHPDVQTFPDCKNFRNHYIFRYSIAAYFLSLKWISEGGVDQVEPSKFRNDCVDVSYVTYATFFDGLLSLDKKANELYDVTIFILKNLF